MDVKHIFKSKDYKDSGFGENTDRQGSRLMEHNGSFNTRKYGTGFWEGFSTYQKLIEMSWLQFLCIVLFAFVVLNGIFAIIYFIIGASNFQGIISTSPLEQFLELFYFSCQTFTTVGYGRINPEGPWVNLVASVQSLIGLLGFALSTGLIYGRFSRPKSNIKFSEVAVIAPYTPNETGLMFRIANTRTSEMVEVSVEVILSWVEQKDEKKIRRFYRLDLERNKVNFFPTSWTVVHHIDEKSPLSQLAQDDLAIRDTELLILVKGFDNTFNQTVNKRASYKFHEIKWNRKFASMINQPQNGHQQVDLRKISDTAAI